MIRRMMWAILAFVALGALVPVAASAQEAYPPDSPVVLTVEPAVCTSNNLHGFASGAVPGSTVHFVIAYPGSSVTIDVVADAQGRADFNTTIPVPRPSGVTVTATGTSPSGQFAQTQFSLTSTVSFAPCTTGTSTGTSTGRIPVTGTNAMPWVRFGAGSLGAGALLVVAARRRRRTPHRQSVAS